MKKNILYFIILLFMSSVFNNNLYAQSNRRDFDSTEMSIISRVITKSNNIILPEKVISELKIYANQNNFPINYVLKNSIMLKMLFNTDLTYTEKKVYLDWAIYNYSTDNKYLPTSYFKKALSELK